MGDFVIHYGGRKDKVEFRINKKGRECFRTFDYFAAHEKLNELNEQKPGIYEMQTRTCRLTKYGVLETDLSGKPLWTIWR